MKLSRKIINDLYKIRKSIESIADDWAIDKVDLSGACALSATLTWRYFNTLGWNPKFLYGYHKYCFGQCHCIILLGDYFLDLTATQFDFNYDEILYDLFDNIDDYVMGKYNYKIYKSPSHLNYCWKKEWKSQHPYKLINRYKEQLVW